jgi:hypothetical protein
LPGSGAQKLKTAAILKINGWQKDALRQKKGVLADALSMVE